MAVIMLETRGPYEKPTPYFRNSSEKEIDIPPEHFELMEACEIDTRFIDRQWNISGYHHTAYAYFNPEDHQIWIVKIPLHKSTGIILTPESEQEDIDINEGYFGPFYTQGKVLKDKTNTFGRDLNYCIMSRFIYGRPVTTFDLFDLHGNLTLIGEQLRELAQRNQKLIKERQRSADLLGLDGTMSLLWALENPEDGKPIEFSNLYIQESDGRIKLIDYDLLDRRSFRARRKAVGLKRATSTSIMFQGNKWITLWLSGADIGENELLTSILRPFLVPGDENVISILKSNLKHLRETCK